MKKTFLLFTFLFAASNLFGAYNVKIAVYKDHANLMTYISKVPVETYRKNILIEKKNHLYYVTSTFYKSKNEVNKALSAYKKVFPDAFIEEIAQETVLAASTEEVAQASEPVGKAINAKTLLENKTVYICNENGSKKAKKQIVKMDFKNEYVIYNKLRRNVPPIEIAYTFDQEYVILPISGIDFKYKIYQKGEDFLSAKSFTNNKEGNRFRYYFDKEAALSFVAGN